MTPEHNKAVAEELVKQRGAEHVRHEFVAWTLSEGCRAVFVLAPGQAPSGGICLPGVMAEVNAHLRPRWTSRATPCRSNRRHPF